MIRKSTVRRMTRLLTTFLMASRASGLVAFEAGHDPYLPRALRRPIHTAWALHLEGSVKTRGGGRVSRQVTADVRALLESLELDLRYALCNIPNNGLVDVRQADFA